jgi:putative ABC transport system permease protein
MFRNYLKVAVRNIKRHAGYSMINVVGLAIGMTCCILILLWVQDELSYDRYHENADRIYRLCIDANLGTQLRAPVTMAPAAPAMISEFPEVVNAARMVRPERVAVKYEDRTFREENVGYADNSVFDIFTFPFISGDPQTALSTPYSVVITEEMAQKYFGDQEPVGKILRLDDEADFTVTAVVKNVPSNSHFSFNMLRSFETLYRENPQLMEAWITARFYTYLLLAENSDHKKLEEKFAAFVDRHMGDFLSAVGGTVKLFLQPLTRIHLYSDFERDLSAAGDITYVYLFSGIALFVLLIACFNFVNLATARSATRAREVGMRKTLGAGRGKLIGQFLGESVIYSFISIVLAFILLELALPLFNSLAQRELSLNYLQNPWLIPGLVGLALAVGLLAGCYPAFFLSSFKPVRVLKGTWSTTASGSGFRRALVVAQFVISIALIIGTITIYNQIDFMKNKKLGFDKEHVLIIPGMNQATRQSYLSIRDQLMSIPGVRAVGASSLVPGRGLTKSLFLPEGFSDNQPQTMDFLIVDPDYFPTMGIKIAKGRNFSADLATDSTESAIINETAARRFGWDNPIGKTFRLLTPPGAGGETQTFNVVGVVKDFHLQSLHQKIEPQIIFYDLSGLNNISVRIAPENVTHTMDLLKKEWQKINPQRPFDYFFMDESFDSQYRAEERLGTITLYFGLLAILIGCLGLFGMSSYTVEQRTKEIGVRKVLGATVAGIVLLLSKEFTRWVLVANVIAWPAAYLLADRWLGNFAYRIGISWTTFVLAGFLALLIALITVSFQAVKAALANPVETLRYE